MSTKKCSECGERKSLRLFYRDIQKSDGLTSRCRDCIRKQTIDSYSKRRESALEYARNYYEQNKDKRRQQINNKRKEIIAQIFELLGNECTKCSFANKIALQIDHLNGGGYKHRRIKGGGMSYYKDILKNIKNYQLLCANCNFVEGVRKGYRTSIWN